MFLSFTRLLLIFSSCCSALASAAAPVPPPQLAEAQLRAINHRFVDAFIAPNYDFMSSLVHDDFVRTAGDGAWQGKEEFLATFRQEVRMAGASYDNVQVRLFGPVAVTHAVFEALMKDGRTGKIRYTDVYVWSGSAWRLVSGQNSVLKEAVPVALQKGTAPAHKPWSGKEPEGDDLAVLQALNENYVNAFREADVAWYDAHLAPDYVVIASDGSMKDRASALADFAKPVFATHIKSFPVNKVRIRRFHDIAIIHAENDFEMKDGRTGVNRYTDIWHKQQDGRWLCVAAHITTYKALALKVE